MSSTVSWRAAARADGRATEGLRERKKRLMREQLSTTATAMFLERGFDAVRIVEIAAACGVSEKTVFNYFPTKESLLLDRFDDTSTALRAALDPAAADPLDAALSVLDDELDALTSWLADQPDPVEAGTTIRRFRELSTSTAGLRAHQYEMTDRLSAEVAEALAARAGLDPTDPRAQIAAIALVGLWRVQGAGLARCLTGDHSPAEMRSRVAADVRQAAETIRPALDALRR